MIDKFMSLKASVKITLIICLFLTIMMFMYFTYQAGMWADFLRWALSIVEEATE